MSGFVSKISAAGSKGWTGLQSLWERDNKTQLTNESPGAPPQEKTSLLSLALPSRHPRGSRLLSEDDDWPDTLPDNKQTTDTNTSSSASSSSTPTPTPSSSTSQSLPTPTPTCQALTTPTTPTLTHTTATTASSSPRCRPKAEKPAVVAEPPVHWTSWVSEEETDNIWLQDDSAHRGILDTDKKKSTRESKRPSPRFKHKITSSSSASKGGDWKYSESRGERGFGPLGKLKGPSFGKLLDADCDEGEMRGGGGGGGGGGGSMSTGCENQVWADDDDDEDAQWRMIEQRAAVPKSN